MDRDRSEGSMKNVKGRMKEGLGKALGDSKMETEGKTDKTGGKIQNTIGGKKHSLRKDNRPPGSRQERPGRTGPFHAGVLALRIRKLMLAFSCR